MKMDKKKWIILLVGIVVIGAAVLFLVFTGRKDGIKKVSLFADSDYPCEYQEEEDGTLLVTLHGERSKELFWEADAEEESFATVSPEGKEKDGEATFRVAPVQSGGTKIFFVRKNKVEDYEFTVVTLTLPVMVEGTAESEDGEKSMAVRVRDRCTIEDGGKDVGGVSTKNPYLLVNETDGTGKILFLNGMSDWEVSGDTDKIKYSQMSVDGKLFIKVEAAEKETTAEETAIDTDTTENTGASGTEEQANVDSKKTETVKLTISSEAEKVKEIIEVTLDAEGNVSLKAGK